MMYRRKNADVEARQITEDSLSEILEWCGGEILDAFGKMDAMACDTRPDVRVPSASFNTHRHQTDYLYIGDWVVREQNGTFHRWPDSAFHGYYERVS